MALSQAIPVMDPETGQETYMIIDPQVDQSIKKWNLKFSISKCIFCILTYQLESRVKSKKCPKLSFSQTAQSIAEGGGGQQFIMMQGGGGVQVDTNKQIKEK